ncbi:unnamed protein product [Haemonchus placei]|uniref:Sulfur globule protein CV3 n=1 Tax=Haemonchus placei TaxID=6290 RepID=A0A0N4WK54_HAEPC|nr:unnamed protein product [Haemonchus placei]
MQLLFVLFALILSRTLNGQSTPETKPEMAEEAKDEASLKKGSMFCMMGGYYPFGYPGYPPFPPFPYYGYGPYGWW